MTSDQIDQILINESKIFNNLTKLVYDTTLPNSTNFNLGLRFKYDNLPFSIVLDYDKNYKVEDMTKEFEFDIPDQKFEF